MRLTKETHILNISFGKVLGTPILFDWTSVRLTDLVKKQITFHFSIHNTPELFEAEKQLENYHSLGNKQTLGYNPRASVKSGILTVNYPDFAPDQVFMFNDDVAFFTQGIFSHLLGFFQRRRVIIGIPHLSPSTTTIITFPPFMAGEFIDSIGFGPLLIPTEYLQESIVISLESYSKLSQPDQQKIEMLLRRYNETLNLPYTYERAESCWRIIEALGGGNIPSPNIEAEYQRLKVLAGVKKESGTLHKFISTLVTCGITYSDDEIVSAFQFRNKSTHEYLDLGLMHQPDLPDIFRFLLRAVEQIIVFYLQIEKERYQKVSYSVIENRIF